MVLIECSINREKEYDNKIFFDYRIKMKLLYVIIDVIWYYKIEKKRIENFKIS